MSAPTHPEKTIEAGIIRFLATLGYSVSKTSQYGKPKGMTVGLPDLYAMHPRLGHALWIEVKTPKGRVSPAQTAWHDVARRAGQTVVVARSAGDLVGPLRELGAPVA